MFFRVQKAFCRLPYILTIALALPVSTVPAVGQTAKTVLPTAQGGSGTNRLTGDQRISRRCDNAVFFDGACRKMRFFARMVPDGEGFVGVFGARFGVKGAAGSAVLMTRDNDWKIRAYHLSGTQVHGRLKNVKGIAEATQPLVGRKAVAPAAGTKVQGRVAGRTVPQPFGGYTLLSRVTATRGMTGGYSSIYTEIAVPRGRRDMTLYASIFRKWGPSRSFDTVTCRSQRNLDDIGSTAAPGCFTEKTIPGGSGTTTAPNIRQQCMAVEEVASELLDWAVTSACGAAGMGLVNSAAGEGATMVFAGVSVETANPIAGAVAAGGTYVFIAGSGSAVVGTACTASGEAVDEFIDGLTGCNNTGLPTDADDWADIYDIGAMLDDAGSEILASPGSCLRCLSSEVETVGGGWNEQEGTMEVIGEVVCNDWEWTQGTDTTGDGFCD